MNILKNIFCQTDISSFSFRIKCTSNIEKYKMLTENVDKIYLNMKHTSIYFTILKIYLSQRCELKNSTRISIDIENMLAEQKSPHNWALLLFFGGREGAHARGVNLPQGTTVHMHSIAPTT